MTTNEQSVFNAESEIEKLKQDYVNYLNPIAIRIKERGENPSLEELLTCQQLGARFFNFVENFVGNSGLLGAHANGKWVTGFAEKCHSFLNAYITHVNFLRSYSDSFGGSLEEPDVNAYANMQRMTKECLPKDQWQELENSFIKNNLPIAGFKYAGAKDLSKTPKWQLVTGLIVGLVFALIAIFAAILIPAPSATQFFIFRGVFAVALAAIAAIIPGLLDVESRFQQFSIRATGAIAVFIIVWLVNPPALVS